jgi:hypothetical protein
MVISLVWGTGYHRQVVTGAAEVAPPFPADIPGALSQSVGDNRSMNTATYELLAASSDHAIAVTIAFVCGLIVACALIWAVRVGMRVMDKDTHHPGLDEQPHVPEGGPVHEMRERREPDEMPITEVDGDRILPHDLHHASTRTGKDQKPRRWSPGSSGSFGGGGLGRT